MTRAFACPRYAAGDTLATMIRRYEVTQLPNQQRWVIRDHALSGACALPDENGGLVPLEWSAREGAESWLYRCRVAWGRGLVQSPEGWDKAA